MRASNLKPILEQLNFRMPARIDLSNIIEWLEALDAKPACHACGQIIRLLQALPAQTMEPAMEYIVLDKLREALEAIDSKLENPFPDAGVPVAKTERVNAELIIVSCTELAQRYWHVAEHTAGWQQPGLQAQMMADALYRGLEALRRTLFAVSLLYDQPYEGFWRLCYKMYRHAESLGLLSSGITGCPAGSDCIDNSFKNLLVYYLSDTRLLTQQEMQELYSLFDQSRVLAKIYTAVPENKAALCFAFALESDLPPLRVSETDVRQETLRYVTTLKLAHSVCRYLKGRNDKQAGMKSGHSALYLKIAKTLSMQEPRKFKRVTENRNASGLVGFNDVLMYLAQKHSNAPGPSAYILSGQLSDISTEWVIPDLNLVPRGEEDLYRLLDTKNAHATDDNARLHAFLHGRSDGMSLVERSNADPARCDGKAIAPCLETIAILDSSAKDYRVLLKNPQAPVKIGELFGIVNKQNDRLEVGIVRRITASGQHAIELRVELLTLQAETAVIWHSSKNQYPDAALYLPRIPVLQQKDSLVYAPHAAAIGRTLVLQRGKDKILCRINKLLNTAAAFNHAELNVIEAVPAPLRDK
ncbi:MAG: hypothetical protein ACU837_09690 [Gammaproteobacteria bacterium]